MKVRILGGDAARIEAIRKAISAPGNPVEVQGTVANGSAIDLALDGQPFDVLIIDHADGASLAAIDALNQQRPGVNTIVISDDQSPEFLRQAMRSGVREVLPRECAPPAMQAAFARVRQLQARAPAGNEGPLHAFVSCKGGSGATFLATNIAYAIAAGQGRRVALFDLNLQFGDSALYVSDRKPPSNIAEVARQIDRLDSSLLESAMLEVLPNFLVLASPGEPVAAADVERRHVEAILQLARSRFDVVIVDVPRTLDALSLRALDMAQCIFPVLQLLLPHFRDARRMVEIFRSLDYPRAKSRFIVNRYEKGGQVTLDDLEQAIGQSVFATIPNDYTAAAAAINLGMPLVKTQPRHPISRAVMRIAQELEPAAAPDGKTASGWVGRMFGAG